MAAQSDLYSNKCVRPRRVRRPNKHKKRPFHLAQHDAGVDECAIAVQRLSIGVRDLPRCSTPTDAFCFHCEHDHAEDCCLYYGDQPEDLRRYSRWKKTLEAADSSDRPPHRAQDVIAGNSASKFGPRFSLSAAHLIEQEVNRHRMFLQDAYAPMLIGRPRLFYPLTSVYAQRSCCPRHHELYRNLAHGLNLPYMPFTAYSAVSPPGQPNLTSGFYFYF